MTKQHPTAKTVLTLLMLETRWESYTISFPKMENEQNSYNSSISQQGPTNTLSSRRSSNDSTVVRSQTNRTNIKHKVTLTLFNSELINKIYLYLALTNHRWRLIQPLPISDLWPTPRTTRHSSELGLRNLPSRRPHSRAAVSPPRAGFNGGSVWCVLSPGVRRTHSAALADGDRD